MVCQLLPASSPWAHEGSHSSLSPANIQRDSSHREGWYSNSLHQWVSMPRSWRTSKRRGLKQQSITSNSTLSLTQCSDRKWKHHSCHMVGLWDSDFCNCYLKDLCYASQTYCHALLAQKCSWHKKFGFACDFIQLLRNNSKSSTSSTGWSTWTAATSQVLNTAEII